MRRPGRQAVEGGVGEDGVSEETDPLGDVAVAGDDETGPAVALDDQGVEIFGFLLTEAMEPEVVEDQEVAAATTRLPAGVKCSPSDETIGV